MLASDEFETTGLCGERESNSWHQSGHQSSYWHWTVLNFSELTRTGVTKLSKNVLCSNFRKQLTLPKKPFTLVIFLHRLYKKYRPQIAWFLSKGGQNLIPFSIFKLNISRVIRIRIIYLWFVRTCAYDEMICLCSTYIQEYWILAEMPAIAYVISKM